MRTAKLLFGLALLTLSVGAAAQDSVTYVYTNPQGTPIAEADEQGNITARFYYTPYGQIARGQAPDGPGYTGHVNDPDTGLVYMQARYYDPKIGRCLSPDPVTFSPTQPQHFNLYWYGNGNPYKYTDPTGKDGWNFIFNPAMTPQQMQAYAQASAARDRINAMRSDPELNYQARQFVGHSIEALASGASAVPFLSKYAEPVAISAGVLTNLDKWNHTGSLDGNDVLGLVLTVMPGAHIASEAKAGKTTVNLIKANTAAAGVLAGVAGAASAAGRPNNNSNNKSHSSSGGLYIKGVRSADRQIKRCLHCTMDQQ